MKLVFSLVVLALLAVVFVDAMPKKIVAKQSNAQAQATGSKAKGGKKAKTTTTTAAPEEEGDAEVDLSDVAAAPGDLTAEVTTHVAAAPPEPTAAPEEGIE